MHWAIFVLSLFASYAQANIIDLTDATYDSTINDNSFVIVNFVKPNCEQCDAFAQEYERIASSMVKAGKHFVVARIDCGKNFKTARKEKIGSMPTVKLFINGNPFEYEGDMKARSILEFIDKKTRPPSLQLLSEEAIEAVKELEGLRCIYAISDTKDLGAYMKSALRISEYTFYHASLELVKKVFPEVKGNNVMVLKNFDERVLIYSGEMGDKFEDFLSTHRTPIIEDSTAVFMQLISGEARSKGALLFVNPDDETTASIEEAYTKVATHFRGRTLIFSVFKTNDTTAWKVADFIGTKKESVPLFAIVEMVGKFYQYRHTGPITEKSMKAFIEDWQSGKVERYRASQPVPEDNTGPLYKAVGKTFNSLVHNNDDDVLLLAYSTSAKELKKAKRVFYYLAKELIENKKLKFVEVDTSLNDIDEYMLSPSAIAMLYPGKNKEKSVRYEGEMIVKDLAKFIQEYASHPVTIPESVFTVKDEVVEQEYEKKLSSDKMKSDL